MESSQYGRALEAEPEEIRAAGAELGMSPDAIERIIAFVVQQKLKERGSPGLYGDFEDTGGWHTQDPDTEDFLRRAERENWGS